MHHLDPGKCLRQLLPASLLAGMGRYLDLLFLRFPFGFRHVKERQLCAGRIRPPFSLFLPKSLA